MTRDPRDFGGKFTNWITNHQRVRFWSHEDGRKLAIIVQQTLPGEFGAMGFEAPDVSSIEAVLDEHAHHIISKHRTELAALRGAEKFARRWLETKSMKSACLCPTRSPKKAKAKAA